MGITGARQEVFILCKFDIGFILMLAIPFDAWDEAGVRKMFYKTGYGYP